MDVFGRRDPDQGWHGLDTGASCPVDQPEKLLRRVDETIRAWVREASEKRSKNVDHLNGGAGGTTSKDPAENENEQNAPTQVKSQAKSTGSNNKQKTKVSGVVNGKANDGAPGGKMMGQRSEVITLD
jgi:hypothetical protein